MKNTQDLTRTSLLLGIFIMMAKLLHILIVESIIVALILFICKRVNTKYGVIVAVLVTILNTSIPSILRPYIPIILFSNISFALTFHLLKNTERGVPELSAAFVRLISITFLAYAADDYLLRIAVLGYIEIVWISVFIGAILYAKVRDVLKERGLLN